MTRSETKTKLVVARGSGGVGREGRERGYKKRSGGGPGQMAQLVGALSCAPEILGSIPGQGTYLGCRFNFHLGHDVSLSCQCLPPSLIFPLSLKSMDIFLGEDVKKKKGSEESLC